MESILGTVKKILGLTGDYTYFDQDIIMHINSVFVTLNQIGVGPENCFSIKDDTTTWSEFTLGNHDIEAVKSYMGMKVRMMFDPPSNSILADSINKNIIELEWRLSIASGN